MTSYSYSKEYTLILHFHSILFKLTLLPISEVLLFFPASGLRISGRAGRVADPDPVFEKGWIQILIWEWGNLFFCFSKKKYHNRYILLFSRKIRILLRSDPKPCWKDGKWACWPEYRICVNSIYQVSHKSLHQILKLYNIVDFLFYALSETEMTTLFLNNCS